MQSKEVAEAISNAEKDIIDILEDLKVTLGVTVNTKSRLLKSNIDPAHKAKIIRLCNNGYTTHQIADRYPQYTVMQISAIKAHNTMGTY